MLLGEMEGGVQRREEGREVVIRTLIDKLRAVAEGNRAATKRYRTGRFIGEDFILAIGDLFNFSPIFKTPTKYIRLLINNN